jgi:FkbM family methyltransferase
MAGLIRPLWFEPVRHWYRLLTDPDYRTCALLETRLGGMPRFTPVCVKVHGWDLRLPDAASFLSAYREIFVEKIYVFGSHGDEPRILDVGANVGLSVLFLKRLYPLARITAFEADPAIFSYLEKNVHGNGFPDVELVNKAAWHENTRLTFSSEGADGGRVASDGDGRLVEVEAVDLGEYLRGQRIDFLKMDIEGAEETVLPACRDSLAEVRYIFVEYHSRPGRKQCLDSIIGILADAGFRYAVQSVSPCRSPFLGIGGQGGFDLQLNIFGWRE